MIIVTGAVIAREDSLDQLLQVSLAHVRRSRTEPGCISHAVHVDAENPLRLVFFEEWADMAALNAHFREPTSLDFVAQVRALAAQSSKARMFDAAPYVSPNPGLSS